MLNVEHGFPIRRHKSMWFDDDRIHPRVDTWAVTSLLVLVFLGLLNLDALGERGMVDRQAAAVLVGAVAFILLLRSRSGTLPLFAWACYAGSIAALLFVMVAGVTTNGARRWIELGPMSAQPSELAKLGLVLALAQVLAVNWFWFQRLALALIVAAVPVGLVLLQPDLSTTAVLTATTLALLVLGRIPLRTIGAGLALAAVAAPLALANLHPYQQERVQSFLSGTGDPDGPGWSILQAHIALAWGGVSGQAGGETYPLIQDYLPEADTDLAFASLVEQWGIAAGVLAVGAAAVLVWRLAAASRVASSRAAGLTAAGFAALIGIEVVVSVASNLGLIPTAGVPFPILSYGGSAAAAHIALVGVVLRMRADAERRQLWLAPLWKRSHPRLVRLTALSVSLQLILMVAFIRHLQTSRGPELREVGITQMTRCVRLPAERGVIQDRHGAVLARNVASRKVVIVPALMRDADVTKLSRLIARSVPELKRQIEAATAITVDVAMLPTTTAERVEDAAIPGVLVVNSPRRNYPHGALLGTILGWTGVGTPEDLARWPGLALGEIVGRAGIEQFYDPILRGVDGRQCVYVSPAGKPIALGPRIEPVTGQPLRLTLDLGLHKRMTEELAAVLAGQPGMPHGDIGGAVAMDPRNGEILAMASLPSYDNNIYGPPIDDAALARAYEQPGSPMLNHVTQAAAPPGSTFKIVVAAANQATPVIGPHDYLPGGGSWTLGNVTFKNHSVLPAQDLPGAIASSNNVYFYQLAYSLGADRIIKTAHQLGVGQPTGVDLPGESGGYFGTPTTVQNIDAEWYPGSTVLLGIGQGYLSVTPLQDARWTAGIATGAMVTPHLGLAYGSERGKMAKLPFSAPKRLPFAAQLGPIRDGMRATVTHGTGTVLQNLPVQAFAKTGTAEDPTAPNEGYTSWMTAAAPFGAPTIVVTSFVRGESDGRTTSGRIAQAGLEYYFTSQK